MSQNIIGQNQKVSECSSIIQTKIRIVIFLIHLFGYIFTS